jgi:hypothetical protein
MHTQDTNEISVLLHSRREECPNTHDLCSPADSGCVHLGASSPPDSQLWKSEFTPLSLAQCYAPFVNPGRSSISQFHPPRRYSTSFCPFGFIFDSDETAQCALSIHAIATGPPRNHLGCSCRLLVLRVFPWIRCHNRRGRNCRGH